VPAGSTVVWTNYDSVPHDVTAHDDGWTSGLLAKGESYSRAFGSPGKFAYVCRVHPYMSAVLIVE
jgi:plastocyanin